MANTTNKQHESFSTSRGHIGALKWFWLACFFISSAALAQNQEADQSLSDESGFTSSCEGFSYYRFVQDWIPTLCLKADSTACDTYDAPFGWVVHGLWPEVESTEKYLGQCKGEAFDAGQLDPIEGELKRVWPNPILKKIDLEEKYEFWTWKHEWEKHGTCAVKCDANVTSMEQYFSIGASLHGQFDIASALEDADINPSASGSGTVVETSKVEAAIRNAFGVTPELQCINNSDGTSDLFSISVCIDAQGLNAIECPVALDSTYEVCPAQVSYPQPS
ncbi:T2 family ribonuclease [Ruegeria jejuensis]|uniref:T2 family ribonuclease n=1 Tax=Ruegeria jejuensis TaxID=3233338 RepID=UPI00355C6089